ncbi:unnamed protein product, partial [Prorocentrum cordatum]
EELAALQEKLTNERAKMERFNAKLDGLNKRIEELAVPSPGKAWAAALAFLQQGGECLDSGTEQREQLAAALDHAKEQKKKEAAAKHAERLEKTEAYLAARTARERADRERSTSVDSNKRRCTDGGHAKEDPIELEAGADELAISKTLVSTGAPPEQAGKVVGVLKCLVGELQPGPEASLAVHTINANTVGPLERAMMQIRCEVRDAVVLGQERQASGTRPELFQTRMRKQAWNIGAVGSAKPDSDISAHESKGRLAVAWVDAYSGTGPICGTAYMWNSEGITERNQRILAKWGSTMDALQQERVPGGDFNMDPEVLQNSEIVGRSARDYFIVSRGLVTERLEVQVTDSHHTAPHLPAKLAVPVRHHDTSKEYAQGHIDGYWRELGTAYEKHLNRYHGFAGDDLSKRQGHFEQANYKWQQRRPKPCAAAAQQPQRAEGAEWLARRLRQLKALASAWQQRGDEGTTRRGQHMADGRISLNIVLPLLAAQAPGQKADVDWSPESVELDGDDELRGLEPQEALITWDTISWPPIVHTLKDMRFSKIGNCAQHYLGLIATLLDLANKRHWKMWTKAPAPWQPQAGKAADDSEGNHELSHPTKATDAALKGWESIWGHPLDDRAPRLQQPTALEWAEHRPPPITPKQAIEAPGRFKPKTGLGQSGWHPRLWSE